MIYENIISHIEKDNIKTIIINKKKDELLGFDYNENTLDITKDKRIKFPKMMIMKIKPNSIAEKNNIRIGSNIIKINNIDVSPENYKELISQKKIIITVNESYCMIYQLLLREGIRFNFNY